MTSPLVSHISHTDGIRAVRSRTLGQCNVSMREKPLSESRLRVLIKGLFQQRCASIHVIALIICQRESRPAHQYYEKQPPHHILPSIRPILSKAHNLLFKPSIMVSLV